MTPTGFDRVLPLDDIAAALRELVAGRDAAVR
jgi:hypothetical protein